MHLKLVVLVRTDVKMSVGKLSAQVAHAAVEAALKADKILLKDWMSEGAKKVVLKVKSDADLHKYQIAANQAGVKAALITDAGHTEIEAGTDTCLAIGPDREEKIDDLTGSLDML